MSSVRSVEFQTYDGLKLKGTLYGAGEKKKPCIIMTAGFGGEKEHFLPDFAARFQAAGYAVLAYDNRNIGESDGSPRDEVDPEMQMRDYFDAFNYAAKLPEVDPSKIVYWGSSMSGGNVLKAAALNKNIAAIIAQVPFVSGEWVSRTKAQAPAGLVLERGHAVASGGPTMVPSLPTTTDEIVQGTSKAILADPAAVPFIDEMARRGYKWSSTSTAQSLANCCLFEPLAYVHRISPTPLFMVVAENDSVTDTQLQLEAFERALQPKKLRLFRGEDHFSLYFGKPFEANVAAQIEFLNETFGI
ncbi:related to hydrolases of the alpha/beta superfamily [Cephalotrichum gorgonifer]|uniref:Related to hydrolases of the alpha/beta superfamily n=1 Tax=Cephalotrichum gorgonifer TaxID=2041049 RepID=A0AAE8SV47_9PEZI|nr:related to hydrolases of the alpha/beta superfamily [Cephalotrichum gorgonifer]